MAAEPMPTRADWQQGPVVDVCWLGAATGDRGSFECAQVLRAAGSVTAGSQIECLPPQMTPGSFGLFIFGRRGSVGSCSARHGSHDYILCESTQTRARVDVRTRGFLGRNTSALQIRPVVRTSCWFSVIQVRTIQAWIFGCSWTRGFPLKRTKGSNLRFAQGVS